MAQKDLLEFVDFHVLECLNQQPNHTVDHVLKQGYRDDAGLFLESDTDEQLLLNVPFTQSTRLSAISIEGPEAEGPRLVKLYVNRPNMGFSDVDTLPSAQDIVFTPETLTGTPIPLKIVKFQSVNVLTLFVEDNQKGTDTSKITKIVLYGSAGESMKVSEIKKQGEGS